MTSAVATYTLSAKYRREVSDGRRSSDQSKDDRWGRAKYGESKQSEKQKQVGRITELGSWEWFW